VLFKKTIILLLVFAMMFVFFGFGYSQEEVYEYAENWPTDIAFTAGVMGGSWFPLGVKISEILMRELPELNVLVLEGGNLINARRVNGGIDAQFGLMYADMVVLVQDGFIDDIKMTNIRATNPFLSSGTQVIVRADSDIYSLDQVLNKRIGSGPVGSGPDLAWQIILGYYKSSYDDIRAAGGSVSHTNLNETASLLVDGHLDAGMFQGPIPTGSVLQAEMTVPMRVLPIPDEVIKYVEEKFPYFYPITVPKNTVYKGTTEDTQILGVPGVLVFNKQLPEDFVYTILKSLMENQDEIKQAYANVDMLSWENFRTGVPEIVAHPAALKLYEEYLAGKLK